MILTLMLYHYMHNSCFSLTFILSHLRLVLILWDTSWCLYHLPDSAIRFSLRITQLLCSPFSANPAKSSFFILPPAQGFHTRQCPSRVQYPESRCSGLVILRAPSALGISSLPLSALQYSFDKYNFFIISGFCSCKCQCLLISFRKIWINLSAHPSSWKIFTCFCQEFDRLYQVKLSSPACCGLFLFFFNDNYCSKSLCRSGDFKCWSLFLSLCHGTSVWVSAKYFELCSVRPT